VYFGLQLGADGRFGYAYLPLYWTEPERRFPYFIMADDRLAGFALAMRGSPASTDPTVLDVAEFFVLRTYRRSGVGARAACALWDRWPGPWIVRAAATNEAAVPFWRQTISVYAGGRPTTERTATLNGVVRHVFTLDSSAEV
jgi:predicted acetyltransferase